MLSAAQSDDSAGIEAPETVYHALGSVAAATECYSPGSRSLASKLRSRRRDGNRMYSE